MTFDADVTHALENGGSLVIKEESSGIVRIYRPVYMSEAHALGLISQAKFNLECNGQEIWRKETYGQPDMAKPHGLVDAKRTATGRDHAGGDKLSTTAGGKFTRKR